MLDGPLTDKKRWLQNKDGNVKAQLAGVKEKTERVAKNVSEMKERRIEVLSALWEVPRQPRPLAI